MRNRSADINRELYRCHADMCKVLSHPTRLEILNHLREEEVSVSDLAERLEIAIGNLSQHLNMMKQRRVLISRKEKNSVYYRLANPKLLKAFDLIRETLLEQMQREASLLGAWSAHGRAGSARRVSVERRNRGKWRR
ncbi:MAG: winged helix-turn-helix transcriptional regulator [Acidobacteria bacterium]|nr:winged helix-turn-helix transcriptional regulator [Acidobacteriota bacterium]